MLAIVSALLALILTPIFAQTQTVSAEERLRALEQRLDKIEGTASKPSLSAFNPAMGAALDLAVQSRDGKVGNPFRSAEFDLEAPIDPFAKGWAVFNGTPDGAAVEEAAIETTNLPANLTVTGGRLFAAFGRFAHFHDHELPVVQRPNSVDLFVGGESQGDGLEVSYLFPTETYIRAVLGAYDRLGSENERDRRAHV
jgi:hypothetical protein